ncbi:MAG: hypothetical protein R3251_04740 [Candidatus Spechtbacterales bacterium]|nr:hypothetical protein [Candidatus Spechtbacterales bacterium]
MQHNNIKIIEGKTPVLVSAPHAVAIRKKETDRTYIRMAEKRADKIVEEICARNGAWGILTTADGVLDGWQKHVYKDYKDFVKKLVKDKGIELVIDVHGAKKTRPFYMDYDFMIPDKHPNDIYVEKLLKRTFAQHFPPEELSHKFYRKIKGSGKKTLTFYVRKHLKIPAVQLEINKALKEEVETFEKVIKMLHEFIETYENTFTGVQPQKEVLYGKTPS